MTHWTLILTIIINWTASEGHSEISRIEGFTSKSTCEIAGRSWKNDLTMELRPAVQGSSMGWGRAYSWTCVGM